MPINFHDFPDCTGYNGHFEIVPWCYYDTQILFDGAEGGLNFFTGPTNRGVEYSNNWIPGMLPNPQSFLIRKIRVWGIASDVALTSFEFVIANKLMIQRPMWTLAVKDGFSLSDGRQGGMMIPTLVVHRARMLWQGEIKLNEGLTYKPRVAIHAVGNREFEDPTEVLEVRRARAIQVCFFGLLARPVQ